MNSVREGRRGLLIHFVSIMPPFACRVNKSRRRVYFVQKTFFMHMQATVHVCVALCVCIYLCALVNVCVCLLLNYYACFTVCTLHCTLCSPYGFDYRFKMHEVPPCWQQNVAILMCAPAPLACPCSINSPSAQSVTYMHINLRRQQPWHLSWAGNRVTTHDLLE